MRRVIFLIVVLIAAPLALAQDPAKVDAQHYQVLLENDQVRVLRIHYMPKEKSVMHEHPASVVVFLSNSKTRFTLPDGSTVDSAGKTGDAQFAEAGKHQPEDVGKTPVEAVLVELKGGPMNSSKVALDPVTVDPAHHSVVFENDRVRVLRITLKANDKTMQHDHPNGVAIYLTDVKAKFILGEGRSREGGGNRGDVTWTAAESHIVQNTSGKPVDIVLVELK